MFRPGHVTTVLLILLASLASPFASGASKEADERAARKACLSGDYAKGVEILSDIFIDTKDAKYIYNQGLCFEQNHRYEDALTRFKEYLRAGDSLSTEDRSVAEKHAAEPARETERPGCPGGANPSAAGASRAYGNGRGTTRSASEHAQGRGIDLCGGAW